MMDTIWIIVHAFAICAIWVCLFVVALKIVWNLCLPYAMLKRGSNKGGVSLFLLIEVIPLLTGVAFAFISSQEGILYPGRLLLYGICAIIISYMHLFAVLFIGGFIMYGRGKDPNNAEAK